MIVNLYGDDVSLKAAQLFLTEANMQNKKIGLTSGVFDLTHYYHLVYLERCRRHCHILIVGVDSDDLVRGTKGDSRPIFPEGHRLRLIEQMKPISMAFLLGKVSDFSRAVDLFNPHYIFKNQAFKEEEILGADKARVITIPDVEEKTSTSQFIEKIQSRTCI